MSVYQKVAEIGTKFFKKKVLFKYGFNLSPMYRRSTGRIVEVSEDLLSIKIKLPLTYKNRNYVNSIFGGSMFSAVDPIPMVQLINLIGDDYVVWDKSAREDLYADFNYTFQEIEEIKDKVAKENEVEIIKTTLLKDKGNRNTYCEVKKVLYIASKEFYKEKRKKK